MPGFIEPGEYYMVSEIVDETDLKEFKFQTKKEDGTWEQVKQHCCVGQCKWSSCRVIV